MKTKISTLYKILYALSKGDHNTTVLSRLTNMTYCQICKIVKNYESEGLIDVVKNGRENIVSLTEKGINALNKLEDLFAVLGIDFCD